ncbi:hypothetical protein [Ruminococcus sp.]|uniref:hypothetical protein n=1 Tax=Ruminococcus sp. TaxID=41978 RepID=UPI0025EFA9A1|nr:hypothetical protein [Ruminococcus sp.]MBQ8968069.1 hypothetical protein [Ruminococcus sp.]
MKITSAQAAKILRKYNVDYANLASAERSAKVFNAAVGEDVEELRPEYDYTDTQQKLDELDEKVRKLKHTINIFNATTVVPDFGMTIDQVLVYMGQLSRKMNKLYDMMSVLPKQRCETTRFSNIIDYTYTNYDPAQAKADYEKTSDTLARLQTALDLVNSTVTFEADI